jgi:alpha-ribazole phosphatase
MNTQILLLRHGQPVLQNCLLGKTDCKLSQLGWQQLEISTALFKNISVVITSPLMRCKQFAMDYAIKNGIDFECVDGWQECDFGDWDGLKYEVLHQKHAKDLSDFISQPHQFTPPNGELLQVFNERVELSLQQLLKEHSGRTILLVTHGGVIRSLVAWCLNMKRCSNEPFQRLSVEYGSVTQIDIFKDVKTAEIFPKLISLNKTTDELNS